MRRLCAYLGACASGIYRVVVGAERNGCERRYRFRDYHIMNNPVSTTLLIGKTHAVQCFFRCDISLTPQFSAD